jgi:hypothetical protein
MVDAHDIGAGFSQTHGHALAKSRAASCNDCYFASQTELIEYHIHLPC